MNFSIIIPTLNEEKYIGKLMDSLQEQTFKDFEIIVVDGNSEDNTRGVVDNYKEKLNLRPFQSPKRGVSFQRNYGARNAKYDRIIFFDADVIVDKDFLEKIRDYVFEEPVGVLTCKNVPLSNNLLDKISYWVYFDVYLKLYEKKCPGALGTFMYVTKKAFDEVNGFSEEIVLGEDMDLVKRIHEKGFDYALLKNPVVYVSVRRMEEEGRLNIIRKNIKAYFYYHLKGSIKDREAFKHEMGKHK